MFRDWSLLDPKKLSALFPDQPELAVPKFMSHMRRFSALVAYFAKIDERLKRYAHAFACEAIDPTCAPPPLLARDCMLVCRDLVNISEGKLASLVPRIGPFSQLQHHISKLREDKRAQQEEKQHDNGVIAPTFHFDSSDEHLTWRDS